jgi:hypothetical protein
MTPARLTADCDVVNSAVEANAPNFICAPGPDGVTISRALRLAAGSRGHRRISFHNPDIKR